MDGFWVALGIVFVAELGDKTQLVVLTMGARQRPAVALLGLAITCAVLMGFAATVGAAVGSVVPDRLMAVAAGVLFLCFAWYAWAHQEQADTDPTGLVDGEPAGAGAGTDVASSRGLLALLVAFALAELGDKTQLSAASLASTNGAVGIWLGATLGLFGATVLALVAGRILADRVPARWLARAGAVAFALVGVVTLLGAALG